MLRSLAVVVGCAIVLTTAHISIMASGGYGGPTAPLQIAVALGLCTGSVCVGAAFSEGRWPLAFVFIVALLSGETYAILTSSEVTLSARDAAAAPVVELAKKRTAALEELAAAETAGPAPADRSRLDAGERAQSAAAAAVRDKATDKGCLANCRVLLQSAVDAAQREVVAARSELDEKTRAESQRLEDRRTAAKAVVAALPPARSATSLADHLHVAGWALDLLIAALRSIAANGLGAALIAFGAHIPVPANRQLPDNASSRHLPAPTVREHAARFSKQLLIPSRSNTPISALYPAYIKWCSSNEQTPHHQRDFGRELADIFRRAKVEIIDVDGRKFICGAEKCASQNAGKAAAIIQCRQFCHARFAVVTRHVARHIGDG